MSRRSQQSAGGNPDVPPTSAEPADPAGTGGAVAAASVVPPSSLSPSPSAPRAGRLHAVDALRALALLGILSVNVWYFLHPEMLQTGMRSTTLESSGDQLVHFFSTLLFESKSYVVFSFLFGLSFVLAWASAHRAGISEVGRSIRRFVALIILGVLHGLFLFVGDILLAYGVLGFALLGMRRIRTKWAVTITVLLFACWSLFMILSGVFLMAMEGSEVWDDAAVTLGDPEAALEAYTGSIGAYLGFQAAAYAMVMPSMLLGQAPLALGAFLIGLVVGRAQLLERIISGEIRTGRLVGWMVPALAVGLTLSAIAAVMLWGLPGSTDAGAAAGDEMMGAELIAMGLAFLAGPIQACGYVILVLLILRAPASRWLRALLAPAGRMSLTNYLSQSAVLALIFSGLGLGLAGELSALAVGGIVLVLWAAQLLVSLLWFQVFRTGPLEGLLRAVSYRRRPSWR